MAPLAYQSGLLLRLHHWTSSQTTNMTPVRVVESIHATLTLALISIQSIVRSWIFISRGYAPSPYRI
ncbi:hypothetical protein F2Q69_00008614 [Brassica cretica]|uniref:Uncharacterized protein n=1 Tax=Brassica cretica TaxID=69181 RepID=A0A8S9P7U5_BRACR|nr:hypothetical protein F2Q69_00008614 [Brassica cretica]